jgi:hypothetical protein
MFRQLQIMRLAVMFAWHSVLQHLIIYQASLLIFLVGLVNFSAVSAQEVLIIN